MKEIFDKTLQRLSALDKRIAALETRAQTPRLVAAKAYRTTVLTIPNNTGTIVPFTATAYMTDTGMWNVSDASKLVAPFTGLYSVSAQVYISYNATGSRYLNVMRNTIEVGSVSVAATNDGVAGTRLTICIDVPMTAGDYVQLIVRQTSGVDRTIEAVSTEYPAYLSIRKVG